MSDQENPEVKIFFDSNRFPWERQYTDGKGNWYFLDRITLYDPKESVPYDPKKPVPYNLKTKYSFISRKIFFDSNRASWERKYMDGQGYWYYGEQILYDQFNHIFYLIDFNNIEITISPNSDTISGSSIEIESLDKCQGPHGPISGNALVPPLRLVSTTSNLPILLFCLDTKELYNPQTRQKFNFRADDGKFYISYKDPKSKTGTYDPKDEKQWNHFINILSNLTKNYKIIESIKYVNSNITYLVAHLEKSQDIPQHPNC